MPADPKILGGFKAKLSLPGVTESPDDESEAEGGESKDGDMGLTLAKALRSGADGMAIERMICDIVEKHGGMSMESKGKEYS